MRYWLIPLTLVAAVAGCSSGSAESSAPLPTPAPVTTPATTPPSPSTPSPTGTSGAAVPKSGTRSATPTATLTVASDGCGVVRSDVTGGSARHLTWSIKDAEGLEVLGRNAPAEDRYRYYRPGQYTVTLTAFLDGAYRPVSNTVSITC